jgi:hypothetical protein
MAPINTSMQIAGKSERDEHHFAHRLEVHDMNNVGDEPGVGGAFPSPGALSSASNRHVRCLGPACGREIHLIGEQPPSCSIGIASGRLAAGLPHVDALLTASRCAQGEALPRDADVCFLCGTPVRSIREAVGGFLVYPL